MEALKNIQTNEFQTKITDELLQNIPEEVQEQLYDILCNVQFIQNLISPNRPRAKDLPRDKKGRIIINLTNPHIIEDSDYFRQPAIHFMKHGCYTFLKPNSNPNSAYRKHWDEEIRRCLEGYVRESDGEWVTGICYWYLNYCPMMVNMIQEGKKKAIRKESMPFFFEGCYWRFHYLNQAREKGHHAIELAKRGAAHPYSEYVYTPEGKKSWSDIKVGDKLFNEFGEITQVTNIPFDDICDIYELTLRDGRKVKASSNHLWSIDFHNRKNRQLMTTLELYNSYKRNRQISKRNPTGVEYVCSIPRNNGVEFPYKETKVDPYTFGLSLGNKAYNKKTKDKFIPDEYKFNSKIVRLNILKGLIDSDGFLGKHDIYQITITSKQLADDILFIARSLGYNSSCNKIKAGYKKDNVYIKCNNAYRVTIYTLDSLSNLPRKQANIKIHNGYTVNKIERTRIIDIKYIGKEKAKCVTVDNNTGLYLINDFILTHNSKSYSLAAIMSHNMILGESFESRRRTITVLTAYQKEYLSDSKDGTLSKFRPEINFIFSNTPFPRLMLKNSPNDMTWQMGYKDEFGREKGSLNMVMAVSAKDDSEKLRGKRGWILYEEMGSFKGLLSLYDITRKSVEDGDYTFAIQYLLGTAAEDESDFSSAKTLLYSPKGYNIYDLENVYDKKNQGKPTFGFFFPSYINRAGCYNKDGVSDVIKALIEILMFRYKIKYNSTDPKSVLRAIAEDPITPAEAIIKVKAAYFPVQALTERLLQIDSNPNFYDGTYIGQLVQHGDKVEFKPTSDIPIRNYGVENDTPGAIEIFNMPEKDLWTDSIVAEYTGRQQFAEDNYEIVRLLCLFYNAKCLYEAHPYDQIIRLPDGTTKLWGDIKIGDEIFTVNNKTTKVIDIPMDGEDDIYRITLQDGRTIESSKGHVWQVELLNHKGKYLITTEQMFKKGALNKHKQSNFFIPQSGQVSYEHKDVPIDPYTMGLLIAEGAFTKFKKQELHNKQRRMVQFSSSQKDAAFYKNVIPYPMKYIGTKGFTYHLYIDNIYDKLKELGLLHKRSEDKFIPSIYLYNDYNTRLELLKGLMDGDGCAIKKGASIYITTSKQLKEDIMLLCRSLGFKVIEQTPKKEEYITSPTNNKKYLTRQSYRVAIATNISIFKLPRKVNKQHIYSHSRRRSKASAILYKTPIINIEYVGKKKCKCITVEDPSELYLIGDYVVTHNCNKKGLYAYFAKLNCTHLLADTPEYLRDKQIIKYSSFGSNAKGVNASAAINNYANGLIRDWLLKPVTMIVEENNEVKELTVQNLFNIKNRALIEELIAFNPEVNVDRIRALGMVMLYREEQLIAYNGDFSSAKDQNPNDYLGNDDFFTSYDKKISKFSLNNIIQ